ncbi:acyl-CoA dehydrogenase family protein [Streptomyces olivochromogenes]
MSRFHAAAKILQIGEGTNEIQRNVIAGTLVKQA